MESSGILPPLGWNFTNDDKMPLIMAEYLEFTSRFEEANLPLEELIRLGKILSPGLLFRAIEEAKKYLTTVPGPNLERRQMLAPDWLEYWLGFLSKEFDLYTDGLTESPNILSFQSMTRLFNSSNKLSGVFFMATGEGGPGHRHAWSIARQIAPLVGVLYEGPKYFQQNPERRRPFLPTAVVASMAVYSGLHVSLIPYREPVISKSTFYDYSFCGTGAKIFFVNEYDPDFKEKIMRTSREFRSLAVIPELYSPHTSDRVQRLI